MTGDRKASLTVTAPPLTKLAIVRVWPALPPVRPMIVPCVKGVVVVGTPCMTVVVDAPPAENFAARLDRLNRHIASPKTWVQLDCDSRRGIWMLSNSRCERHLISMPVRLQPMSEMRPENRMTVPELVSP